MGVPKRMAVAVSGLVFAGGAALAVGAAAPASAQAMVAAPQQLVTDGCGCGRSHNRWRASHRNHFRHNQRVIVINRNNNFSKSDAGQFQRNQQRRNMNVPGQQMRDFDDEDD